MHATPVLVHILSIGYSGYCELSRLVSHETTYTMKEILYMITAIRSFSARFIRDEEGATLVEYVLLVAVLGISCIVGLGFIDTKARNTLSTAGNAIP